MGTDNGVTLHLGDCLDVLAAMEPDSVDTCITDPPYALTDKHGARTWQYGEGGKKHLGESNGGFMGMKWDGALPGIEYWQAISRVLKPGAMLLAFGGTRTHHRLMCAIEDAGFEIRDDIMYLHSATESERAFFLSLNVEQRRAFLDLFFPNKMLLWVYGSGFPKGHRVDKGIRDKLQGVDVCQCDANTHNSASTSPEHRNDDHKRKVDACEDGVHCQYDAQSSSHRGASSQADCPRDRHSGDEQPRPQPVSDQVPAPLLEYAQVHSHSDERGDDQDYESEYSPCQAQHTDRQPMRDCSRQESDCADPQESIPVNNISADTSESVVHTQDNSQGLSWFTSDGKYSTGLPRCQICGKPMPQYWEGWNVALKPAYEPIILAMKPRDGTFAHNALVHGVAGLWIDGARVPTNGDKVWGSNKPYGFDERDKASQGRRYFASGRWPANLLLDEEAGRLLDEQSGERGLSSGGGNGMAMSIFGTDVSQHRRNGRVGFGDTGGASRFFYCPKASRAERNEGIEGVTLELEVYLCGANTEQVTSLERAISEYVTVLETQLCNIGSSGNGRMVQFHRVTLSITSTETNRTIESRTWNVLTLQPISGFILAVVRMIRAFGGSLVASAESLSQSLTIMSERAGSARGAEIVVSETPLRISASARPTVNGHPTIKPVALLEYLCRLTKTPTGGVVLDPFMGSGSTGIACINEGRSFIGIEIDPEYYEIAQRRIEHAQNQVRQLELIP